jgi:hypothetical protein
LRAVHQDVVTTPGIAVEVFEDEPATSVPQRSKSAIDLTMSAGRKDFDVGSIPYEGECGP